MKKLVDVVLAPNDSGVLYSLSYPEQKIGEGGRLDNTSAFKIIGDDSYSELMRGDALRGRKGVILYASEEEYEKLKKEGKVD